VFSSLAQLERENSIKILKNYQQEVIKRIDEYHGKIKEIEQEI